MISATDEVAVREWVKVPNISGLYRHTVSGRYYGVKKIHGRRRERSFDTTDRKIAERRHREWIGNLQRVDRERERTTLRELLERFVAVNQGRSIKTQKTNRSIIRHVVKTWPGAIDIEVRQIRPSHLDEWLAVHETRLKNTTEFARHGHSGSVASASSGHGQAPLLQRVVDSVKPTPKVFASRLAPLQGNFSVFATDPACCLSLSR